MNPQEFVATMRQGELTVDEIGRGMHRCYQNACDLIEDAELVLEKRPARAISLAVLALEETAKTFLLCNAAAKAKNGPIQWIDIEKILDLRSHQHKQQIFAAYGSAFLAKFFEAEGRGLYDEKMPESLAPLLNWFKQMGFYVNVAEGRFVAPDEFGADNSDWATWLISMVKDRLKSIEPLHATEDGSIRVAVMSGKLIDILEKAPNEETLRAKLRDLIDSIPKDVP